MAIEFYKEFGELGYLANYSNHGFWKNGIYYKTVEHYYQSEKFSNPLVKEKIIHAATPKEASIIGRDRNNKRIPRFRKIKNRVMYEGILEKFRQNRAIAYKLIETRTQSIAEATVDEYYWGIGKDKSGQNVIGKILEKVREEIKREIIESILYHCKGKEIYVLGHKNPDIDSIFSSYLLSNILKKLGIHAQFAILEEAYAYNKKDERMLHDVFNEKPVLVDKDHFFVLVDHNSLDGLCKENVLGAFDHHVITTEIYDTLEMEYASTGLLLYDLFKNVYSFSSYEKYLIYLTVLSDTDYLSSRYSSEDQALVEELGFSFSVVDLQKKYFQTTDFRLPIEDNLRDDYKEYVRNNRVIKRSILSSYDQEYEKYYKEYVAYVEKLHDYRLLIWCCYDTKNTYVYFNGFHKKLNYILTSTHLIMKMLEEESVLQS